MRIETQARSRGRDRAKSRGGPTAALTLMELLVVIAIIAILAAILLPYFRGHKPGKDALPRVLAMNGVGTARPQTTLDLGTSCPDSGPARQPIHEDDSAPEIGLTYATG